VPVDIQFQPKRGLEGILSIRANGQPDIQINDELWHQLMHLSRAAGELAGGHRAAVPYSGMPGGYELAPEGDEVVVSGDYIATARYPLEDFRRAVFAATERWLAYAAQVGDPDHAGVAPEVAAALAEAGGTPPS
jgi:hypothetical protein